MLRWETAGINCWCSSVVEQLICNQPVASSNLVTSFPLPQAKSQFRTFTISRNALECTQITQIFREDLGKLRGRCLGMTRGKLTVTAINERLKAAKVGVTVRQKGSSVYLRATLPPKAGETTWKQRDVSLRIYANPAGLERAEAEARKLGALLACKEFD